jgi:hypothetical protein
LSLPDVPGVAVLSPSPAPVPVVPVWLGLVSIGGSSIGELVGLAEFPVVSPGVVAPLPVELGFGAAPELGWLPPTCVGALLPIPVPVALPALEPGVA